MQQLMIDHGANPHIRNTDDKTGGPNCVFLQMRFAQMRFFEKRNCVQPVCVLNATVFCPIAFKTQACLVRLRFKRNCASPVAFFDILTNRLKTQ